jgi:hypothetical protein
MYGGSDWLVFTTWKISPFPRQYALPSRIAASMTPDIPENPVAACRETMYVSGPIDTIPGVEAQLTSNTKPRAIRTRFKMNLHTG